MYFEIRFSCITFIVYIYIYPFKRHFSLYLIVSITIVENNYAFYFQKREYNVDKRQICITFSFLFKLVGKPVETARFINEAFDTGTTSERTTRCSVVSYIKSLK